MPVIHDLACTCGRKIANHVFAKIADIDSPVPCQCGKLMEIEYNTSYGRSFAGAWNGLQRDKIVVYEHPDGRVQYPGRTDVPMPERYRQQGFERKELAPWEVTGFEKRNGVTCESLHWGSGGNNAPEEDPVPELKIEDVPLVA